MFKRIWLALTLLALLTARASADPMLADFAYPFPVKTHAFRAQGHDLTMAYMDIAPDKPNGKTAVLLHGKNFCGATWEGVAKALVASRYRVVIPDQIGFCKSSKPETYHYSFHELAANTRGLLASLQIDKPILIGHSMGGMLAVRYALSFPNDLSRLVLVNPIGLEDWRAKGVPEKTVDELFEGEKKTTAASIKAYQQKVYYSGDWKPEYDRWVDMLASMYKGPGGEQVARAQALTSKMAFSDPVVHEFERIAVLTALLIGEKDITAIGRDRVTPDVAATLGNYASLGKEAAARIKGARLIPFPNLGHSPHIENPDVFMPALLEALGRT